MYGVIATTAIVGAALVVVESFVKVFIILNIYIIIII